MLPWLCYVILFFLFIAGMVLAVFTLPGLWLMTASAAGYAVLTHYKFIGPQTLLAMLVASIIAEIIDVAWGGVAAKKAGGGYPSIAGGLIGGIIGGIFLTFIPIPVVSTIVGICLGAFFGAALMEMLFGRKTIDSLQIGLGAAKGKFLGIVAKLVFGGVMFVTVLWIAAPFHI
ncbi:MAG: DUF456 domain-containing protein [Tepidisphaeraceae bacterium]|jgi:uncharacterized protein YqgC (DUF456 family)